ncbi:unnamed protein product [Symbiodinium natans]|uniref:Uncharacterized protein n=1 Tax=Symbiodinium natans TaxID=878477 RepID=A0A812HD71_9DINO|nr:unnamed protein product [Symbiodinium natans]
MAIEAADWSVGTDQTIPAKSDSQLEEAWDLWLDMAAQDNKQQAPPTKKVEVCVSTPPERKAERREAGDPEDAEAEAWDPFDAFEAQDKAAERLGANPVPEAVPDATVADAWDAFDALEAGDKATEQPSASPAPEAIPHATVADAWDAFGALEAQDKEKPAEQLSAKPAPEAVPNATVADAWDAFDALEAQDKVKEAEPLSANPAPEAFPNATVADAWDAFDALEDKAEEPLSANPAPEAAANATVEDAWDAFDALEAENNAVEQRSLEPLLPTSEVAWGRQETATQPMEAPDRHTLKSQLADLGVLSDEDAAEVEPCPRPARVREAADARKAPALQTPSRPEPGGANQEAPEAVLPADTGQPQADPVPDEAQIPKPAAKAPKGLPKLAPEALERLPMKSQLVALGLMSEDEEMSSDEADGGLEDLKDGARSLLQCEDMEIVSNASDEGVEIPWVDESEALAVEPLRDSGALAQESSQPVPAPAPPRKGRLRKLQDSEALPRLEEDPSSKQRTPPPTAAPAPPAAKGRTPRPRQNGAESGSRKRPAPVVEAGFEIPFATVAPRQDKVAPAVPREPPRQNGVAGKRKAPPSPSPPAAPAKCRVPEAPPLPPISSLMSGSKGQTRNLPHPVTPTFWESECVYVSVRCE